MFGLSWGQIAIIVIVGVFVLGPERIPTAVTWVLGTLRKVKTMAAGAQEGLRSEIGPEIDELRRQVADLQSLKEIQGLRELRDLSPRKLITKNLLGDEFAGGIGGFLGLNNPVAAAPATAAAVSAGTAGTAALATVALATDGPETDAVATDAVATDGAAKAGLPAVSRDHPAQPVAAPSGLITVGAGPVDVEAHRAMLTKSFSAMAAQAPPITVRAPELALAGVHSGGADLLVPGVYPPFDTDGT